MQVNRPVLTDPTLLTDRCYIAGACAGGTSTIDVTDPADDRVIGTVRKLGTAETRRAIHAAVAQKRWAVKAAPTRNNKRSNMDLTEFVNAQQAFYV